MDIRTLVEQWHKSAPLALIGIAIGLWFFAPLQTQPAFGGPQWYLRVAGPDNASASPFQVFGFSLALIGAVTTAVVWVGLLMFGSRGADSAPTEKN